LSRQFKRAVAQRQAFEREVMRVVDSPRFREMVVGIVDEVIRSRIGLV
jgi:hypothetical protein